MQVIAYKHNGDISKLFHDMQPVLERDDVVVLYSAAGTRVDNVQRQDHWIRHYAAYSIFPKSAFYNFAIVEKENGIEYYCNLAAPVVINGDQISYIDYDIDLVLSPTGELSIHDTDEFSERSQYYPVEIIEKVLEKQKWLESALVARQGFFDPDFYKKLKSFIDIF